MEMENTHWRIFGSGHRKIPIRHGLADPAMKGTIMPMKKQLPRKCNQPGLHARRLVPTIA